NPLTPLLTWPATIRRNRFPARSSSLLYSPDSPDCSTATIRERSPERCLSSSRRWVSTSVNRDSSPHCSCGELCRRSLVPPLLPSASIVGTSSSSQPLSSSSAHSPVPSLRTLSCSAQLASSSVWASALRTCSD